MTSSGHRRPGHVRDDAVHGKLDPIGEVEVGEEPRAERHERRRHQRRPAVHEVALDRFEQTLGPLRLRVNGLDHLLAKRCTEPDRDPGGEIERLDETLGQAAQLDQRCRGHGPASR